MAGWDGNGNVTLTYDWTDDLANTIPVTASRMDAQQEDLRGAIENAMAKDGQNAATADLDMGGNQLTNMGNAVARTDAATAAQIQDGAVIYGNAAGSSNAYTLTLAPAITAYATGSIFIWKANHTNDGSATLNVNGVGAVTLKRSDGTSFSGGEITTNMILTCVYDGTDLLVQSPTKDIAAPQDAAQILAVQVFS